MKRSMAAIIVIRRPTDGAILKKRRSRCLRNRTTGHGNSGGQGCECISSRAKKAPWSPGEATAFSHSTGELDAISPKSISGSVGAPTELPPLIVIGQRQSLLNQRMGVLHSIRVLVVRMDCMDKSRFLCTE